MGSGSDAVVIGAGIAGASSALALRRRGLDVTLIDAWAPGHSRAASGGEHRILRSSHGGDDLYARWSREARLCWLQLGEEVGSTLFVQSGCVMLAREGQSSWEDASQATLARLGIPHFVASAAELAVRLPGVSTRGLSHGLWEPESGFVYARRGLQAMISRFLDAGGRLIRGLAITDAGERLFIDGARVDADIVICACGAWMRDLFRRTLGRALDVVRQDVILVAPPAGSTGYDDETLPAWVEHQYPAYGIPASGGYGFKAVIVWRELRVDLERDDRVVSPASIARSRRYLAHRFPDLAERPITGQEVGQIANTADTHFIIDRHPTQSHLVLVAGDSGHLFKHGPVAG
jgi:sarcosine oxidase